MKRGKKCKYCKSNNIKRNGRSASGKQRYLCLSCNKSQSIKNAKRKIYIEQHWFNLWIKEGYNIRQLSEQSGHSKEKIKGIIRTNISKDPPESNNLNNIEGIIVDGTFIYKRICLFAVMDAKTHRVIQGEYPLREFCFTEVIYFLSNLKERGLMPKYVVLDGNPHVIKAVSYVYPNITIQRCLTHIQRQGLAWCRQRPTKPFVKELRLIVKKVPYINTEEEKEEWIKSFKDWKIKNKRSFTSLNAKDRIEGDIIKAVSVLQNALPSMFHYLDDYHIPKSTSCLEGYFSRLKHKYFAHRGLNPEKRPKYFKWFIYLCSK